MLDTLVRARGLQRFAYFLVTGEGSFLPNGVEVTGGHVLDARCAPLPCRGRFPTANLVKSQR